MNLYTDFHFKVKEVIGYTAQYDKDPEEDDDARVISVDVYLSGGQTVTLDLSEFDVDSNELVTIFDYDSAYWNSLYGEKDISTNLCKPAIKSEVKSKSTYNPYE